MGSSVQRWPPGQPLFLQMHAMFGAYWVPYMGGLQTTLPVPPPTAIAATVLNIACIDTRDNSPPYFDVREDVTPLCVTVGEVKPAGRGEIYQHMHVHPVKPLSPEERAKSHGFKVKVEPARRQILTDLNIVLGIATADRALLDRIVAGVQGKLDAPRYGFIYAGSSDFCFDRIEVLDRPPPVRWYARLDPRQPRPGSHRFPTRIDRKGSASTACILAPLEHPTDTPPESAWIWTPKEPN